MVCFAMSRDGDRPTPPGSGREKPFKKEGAKRWAGLGRERKAAADRDEVAGRDPLIGCEHPKRHPGPKWVRDARRYCETQMERAREMAERFLTLPQPQRRAYTQGRSPGPLL
ncbi:hypothetical protein GCM10010106_30750 [Thermopolyspora flexuosa]|nr:hypothetical protein GCM10010106_30750 [Thermopolyspora flexuosa]